ncbi:MAG TPA: hypothetical protein VNL96_00070 [Gemmatimonadaceae bacterium]|nr:hypothetical protein [Gemmatimonadaceae bacterium]
MSDVDERVPRESKEQKGAGVDRSESESAMGSFVAELQDGDLAKPMALSDFLFRLGLAYRLPEKKTGEYEVRPVARPPRTRVWLPVLAVVMALGWVGARLLQPRPGKQLPRELTGEWVAQSPKYPGRALVLQPGTVTLKFGADTDAVSFPISAVLRDSVQDTAIYRVQYLQDGQSVSLVVKFFETPRPTVVLSSPAGVVWLRQSDVGYDSPALDTGRAAGSPRGR